MRPHAASAPETPAATVDGGVRAVRRHKAATSTPRRWRALLATVACAGALLATTVHAQQPPQPPGTAREAAPVDLTGTWVSVITEDWRWRMVTPARGDFASIPLTEAALEAALAWDPAADEAAGEACRSYGAAALMRVPGHVRITWQDTDTLRVEVDNGTQTRLLRFAPDAAARASAEPSWQGYSVAEWETTDGEPRSPRTGSLKVVTTRLRAGYLRKNGVPYSADAVLTEYWDLNEGPDGAQWLVITSVVDDPRYLDKPYVTSPNFRKQAGDDGWQPTPCSTTW